MNILSNRWSPHLKLFETFIWTKIPESPNFYVQEFWQIKGFGGKEFLIKHANEENNQNLETIVLNPKYQNNEIIM